MVTWWEQRIAADEDAKQMDALCRWRLEQRRAREKANRRHGCRESRELVRARRDEILRLWRSGIARKEICARLGLTKQRVSQVILRETKQCD